VLYAALILVSGIVGALLTALLGKRRRVATGQPTPEEAKITVEHDNRRAEIAKEAEANTIAILKKTDEELESDINRDGFGL
jgi:hypothetical protein